MERNAANKGPQNGPCKKRSSRKGLFQSTSLKLGAATPTVHPNPRRELPDRNKKRQTTNTHPPTDTHTHTLYTCIYLNRNYIYMYVYLTHVHIRNVHVYVYIYRYIGTLRLRQIMNSALESRKSLLLLGHFVLLESGRAACQDRGALGPGFGIY